MKKTCSIGILLLALILSSCNDEKYSTSQYEGVDVIENVSMTVKGGTITPEGLTVIITDKNEPSYIYSEWYCIERKLHGEWMTQPILRNDNYGFTLMGYSSNSGMLEFKIDWEGLYGSLKTGVYRILKEIYDDGTFYISAEFEIK